MTSFTKYPIPRRRTGPCARIRKFSAEAAKRNASKVLDRAFQEQLRAEKYLGDVQAKVDECVRKEQEAQRTGRERICTRTHVGDAWRRRTPIFAMLSMMPWLASSSKVWPTSMVRATTSSRTSLTHGMTVTRLHACWTMHA